MSISSPIRPAAVKTWVINRRTLLAEGVIACLARPRFDVHHFEEIPDGMGTLPSKLAAPVLCILLIDSPTLKDETCRRVEIIRQTIPSTVIVVITTVPPDAARLLHTGADACLSVTYNAEQLVFLLEQIVTMDHGICIFPRSKATFSAQDDGSLFQPLAEEAKELRLCKRGTQSTPKTTTFLSQREREVLAGLYDGESNKVVARRLAITDATVKAHVRALFRKLNAHSRTQAVRRAMAMCPEGVTFEAWLRQAAEYEATPNYVHND